MTDPRYLGGPRCGEPVPVDWWPRLAILLPTGHSPSVRHVYFRSSDRTRWLYNGEAVVLPDAA